MNKIISKNSTEVLKDFSIEKVEKKFKKLKIHENINFSKKIFSKEEKLVFQENEIYGYKNFTSKQRIFPLKSMGPKTKEWKSQELKLDGDIPVAAPLGSLPKHFDIFFPKNAEEFKKLTDIECDKLIVFYGLFNLKTKKSYGAGEIDFELKKEHLLRFLNGFNIIQIN